MSNRLTHPPDGLEGLEGNERTTPEEECEIDGHNFEGYDTISEICAVCGLIREYATKPDRRRNSTRSDEIHTCMSDADHAFGLKGRCVYCGKSEATLTEAECELHSAVRQQRRAASAEGNPAFDACDID